MERLTDFLGEVIERIEKINSDNMSRIKEDINMIEMKQGLRALWLQSLGGPDGMNVRLLKYVAKFLPNLVLGAI